MVEVGYGDPLSHAPPIIFIQLVLAKTRLAWDLLRLAAPPSGIRA